MAWGPFLYLQGTPLPPVSTSLWGQISLYLPCVRTPSTVFTHNTSGPKFVGFSSHQPVLPLSGHQLGVLQSNSILTLASRVSTDPIALGAQVHKTAFTSDTSCKYWVLRLPPLCQTWTQSQGFPQPSPFRFDNLLEQLTELREMLYLPCSPKIRPS